MSDNLNTAVVYVVDDEEAMRDSLSLLLRSAGFAVVTFENADDLLSMETPDVPACVVMDVRLRGQSGLTAHQRLKAMYTWLPVIFTTGHGDIEMSVKAMKGGAFDFLSKPFREQNLLDIVADAIAFSCKERATECAKQDLLCLYESLTLRERDVMILTVGGLRNKEIAAKMNLSEATVKIHRSQAMKKMQSRSVAELVLKARELGVKASL